MRTKLRSLLAILLLAASLAALPLSAASATTLRTSKDPLIAAILTYTNQYRASYGLAPVLWSQAMASVSQSWAEQQNAKINNGSFSMATIHRSDAGGREIPAASDWYAENIGINTGARQIVDWWMNSPDHRAAMLNPRATDIGLGWMKTTKSGYAGQYIVVENLAGYATARAQIAAMDNSSIHEGDVAAVDSSGALFVYPSARGNDLWQRIYLGTGWKTALSVDVTDWNADGTQDVVTRWRDGRLTVNLGRKSGGLGGTAVLGGAGWAPYDIQSVRWRSTDKFPGVLARNTATGQFFYYPNPSGSTPGARILLGNGWGKLTTLALDFDDNGRMDVLARNAAGQQLLYRSNGAGGFLNETRRVVGNGWSSMTHLSAITNHLGNGAAGILARDRAGNLYLYPVGWSVFSQRSIIGRGGWDALLLGS